MKILAEVIAKALVLSYLVSNTLEVWGVHTFWWMLFLTLPISFALYAWFGLATIDVEEIPKGDEDER